MTSDFDRFMKWTIMDRKTGYRKIKDDAPKEIKEAAKRTNEEYYKKTGRNMP